MNRPIINNIEIANIINLLNLDNSLEDDAINDRLIRIRSRKIVANLTLKSKNYGDFIIIGMSKSRRTLFTIKFINTGYISHNVYPSQLKTGEVKDLLAPSLCNIGRLGEDFYDIINDIELHKILYTKWNNMIRRCYDKNSNRYYAYGAMGVTVSDRWLTYTNFFHDVQKLDGYDRDKLLKREISIDKDKYQKGVKYKIYSNTTCCWLSIREQNILVNHDVAQNSLKRCFIAIDPYGTKYFEKGISKFAKRHNLDSGDCSRALNGKIDHVKGYTFYPLSEEDYVKNRE